MITQLDDLPEGVLGFEITGKIEAEDYRDVVIPALEQAAQAGEVRFVIVVPEFHGMTPGALWQDLKVGVEHFRAWKRIAVITDLGWVHHMTSVFGWMTPGEVKTFALTEREQGIAWAAG
jgi:hypothetical protein